MLCQLECYSPIWENSIRNFSLSIAQMGYVFLPSKALDFFNDEDVLQVVILDQEMPVGYFVLHGSQSAPELTYNYRAIILRSFSIDKKQQGKGYAKAAMLMLGEFVKQHFPYGNEIILTVHEDNTVAKQLYEKTGFSYIGCINIENRKTESIMHYRLD